MKIDALQAESTRLHAIDAAYLEQSYLGRVGKWLQPVFAPAGYDWKITVGILASFPAREIIVSTLESPGISPDAPLYSPPEAAAPVATHTRRRSFIYTEETRIMQQHIYHA